MVLTENFFNREFRFSIFKYLASILTINNFPSIVISAKKLGLKFRSYIGEIRGSHNAAHQRSNRTERDKSDRFIESELKCLLR
jgi:hypothetical protein